MSEKRFTLLDETIFDNEKQAEDGGRVTYWVVSYGQRQRLVDLLNEQQATIDKQELKLQQLEEILELSENLNKSYREKLIEKTKEIDKLTKENEQLHYQIIDLQDKLCMSEKVINDE